MWTKVADLLRSSSTLPRSDASLILIMSFALSACTVPITSQFVPSRYDGSWNVTMTSNDCGDTFKTRTGVNAGGIGFVFRYSPDFAQSSTERAIINGSIIDGVAERKNVDFTNGVEFAEFRIEFSSSTEGMGSWRTTSCSGKTRMTKIK